MLKGRSGKYHTIESNMPPNHQSYAKWDGKRFIKWAANIGPNTQIVIKSIVDSYKIEQQAYRSCMGLIKLSEKYSIERLESACTKALTYTSIPRYKSVITILSTGQDKLDTSRKVGKTPDASHSFIRGAAYYGGVK
uniref:Transposase n=1 Tax=uncultured microorganism TaxID=358574 RepID=I2FJK9_9ZZZZ|nr:hypothetical protein [uncultured microorganism]